MSKLADSSLRILTRRGWRREGGALSGLRWSWLQAERNGNKQLRNIFEFAAKLFPKGSRENSVTLQWRKAHRTFWTQRCKLDCA